MKIIRNNKVQCNVNGCDILIPSGMPYVSINVYGTVQSWYKKPSLSEGIWKRDEEEGAYICSVRLEDGDIWTHLFDVSRNRFLTYSDCD